MSGRSTTINLVIALTIVSAVLIGWFTCALSTLHQLQEDIIRLKLRENFDISTIRRLYGGEASPAEASKLQEFKTVLGSKASLVSRFRSLEDKQTLLLESKRLQLQGDEFRTFEQESSDFTRVISDQALDDTNRLYMMGMTGGFLCIALSAAYLFFSGTQKAGREADPVSLVPPSNGTTAGLMEDQQWRTIFNSLPVGIITADEHGAVQIISQEALRILQFKSTTIDVGQGLTITELFGNSDLAGLLERSMGQPLHLTTIAGKDVSIALRTVRYRSVGGDSGFLLSLLDVSKKVELDKLKAQFIAMVGHDLRAPLTSINGFLRMLMDGQYGEIPTEAQEILQLASDDVLRVLRLCNSLLDIQRLERSDYSIVLAVVSVADIFARASRSLGAHIQDKALIVDRQAGEAQVRANEELLLQVVINLLSNAIKFSPGNSTIHLCARVQGPTVEISVVDEGPGVEPNSIEKIFQPGDRSKLTSAESAGFGLSLVRLIIEKHKGTVSYRANKPCGSIFTVELPRA